MPNERETRVLLAERGSLEETERLRRQVESLRGRLARLSESSIRIMQVLDPEAVLQEVLEGARSLVNTRSGAIAVFDDLGRIANLVTTDVSPEKPMLIGELSIGQELLRYVNELDEPLRVKDIAERFRLAGFPEDHPITNTFLDVPLRFAEEQLGAIYLTEKRDGEFTEEDREILSLFAAQASLAIANAQRHSEELQAKADLEALINISPIGVLVFDANTLDLVSLNQETRRMLGGLSGAGRSLEGILQAMSIRKPDGEEISRDEGPLAEVLRSGESVRAEELAIHLPDGRQVTILINATPIFSQEGEMTTIIATMQDMTPVVDLERMRSEFLGMVSHELRTPLTTIKGSAATMLASSIDMEPIEIRHFFRIIDEQADHMRDLINNLLDVTRIEAGTFSVNPMPMVVTDLVEQARTAYLRGGGRNTINVHLPQDLPMINADRQRILQVLNNLFSNASKYSPTHSEIRVTGAKRDVYVSISVIDEGRGISSERLPHVFNKFFRADSDGQAGGSGLGLAICKGIVEAHGGRIWAESEIHKQGMRFTFTIPAVEKASIRSAASEDRLPPNMIRASGQRELILAVDDEPQILRYIRATLSDAGYTSATTTSPDEVERLIELEKPHLVLLDLKLPGTDGVRVMRRIQEITDVPVIFLSAYNRDQDILRAFEAGADDYIVKPFSPTELVARIKTALRRQRTPAQTRGSDPYRRGDLAIDYTERLVTVRGVPATLTATEYKLLVELSLNAGRVMTHDRLLRSVWGRDYSDDSRLLRSFVKKLRHKLGDDANSPQYIVTEPRVGYRMKKPESLPQ